MKRLVGAILLSFCMLFTGCLRIVPTDRKAELSLDAIVDANYITTLTASHPGITVISSTVDGDGVSTAFFLYDGEIARCDEGTFRGEPFCTGVWKGISFAVSDDGTVSATSPADEFAGDAPSVPLTDSKGRYYADNAFLLYPLMDETAEIRIAEEYGGTDVTIFAGLESGESCTYTADRKTLLIRHYFESWDNRTVQVSAADASETYMPPTRAAAALIGAERTRTLTYHTYLNGQEKDYVFEIPADWTFSFGVYGDIRFFSDEGQTNEVDNLIPADGKDYVIWVSDAKG